MSDTLLYNRCSCFKVEELFITYMTCNKRKKKHQDNVVFELFTNYQEIKCGSVGLLKRTF